ncbi:MAG: alcohol dehydrogenase catalytic domain-containing protein [Deltaproteobacteria bacterium]|jgi:L-iditol 2-dehydrogenase|nr:alcohol dehydrogenase catalytic domain-containing protein [Deltaproteobacteria bacterium]MCL5880677.1 alcohol dehydrogenase catalytic domain-containing protein [Deltaproteobacteria bacterium]MDA8305188.1 alcohol dehydrogenase catalytic domain-containing protein [Deltaproteobacteria bacterium]
MRCALYYSNKDIRIIEKDIPKINGDEILMRVMASGICGSDVIEWYRRDKVPLVLGHEVAGVIVNVGKNVKGYKVGDRICAAHHVPCNTCKYCLSGHQTVCDTLRSTNFDPGGFSEFLRLPEINVKNGVYVLPDSVSFEEGTFVEPLACVVRGQRLAGIKPADTALVIGSGLAGLLHINLLRTTGASRIIATDINDKRLEYAKNFGADYVFNASNKDIDLPEAVKKINDGFLADVVILSTGADSAVAQGLKSVRRGGTVLFFGAADEGAKLPLAINEIFWRTEVALLSSYAGSILDHRISLELIRSKRVNVKDMITNRLPLKDIAEGFALTAKAQDSLKIIINPNV